MKEVTFVQKAVIKHPDMPNKFLLLIRNQNDKSRPGDYDIPGGSVQEGELHENALLREVKEETGIKITDLIPLLIRTTINVDTGKYFLYIGYSAVAQDTEIVLNSDEHSSYVWLTLEEFKSKTDKHMLIEQIEIAYKSR